MDFYGKILPDLDEISPNHDEISFEMYRQWRSAAFLVVELVGSVEIVFKPIDPSKSGWVSLKPSPTCHRSQIWWFPNWVGQNFEWVKLSGCLGQAQSLLYFNLKFKNSTYFTSPSF